MSMNDAGHEVEFILDKKLFDMDINYYHVLNLNTSSWLVCGSSGSGKSVLVKYTISQIVKTIPDCEITICDGKADDYLFLRDIPNARYYEYLDMCVGLDNFYASFANRMSGKGSNRHHMIIVLEEWSSVLNVLNADKETAKIAKKALAQLFSITSQGRSFSVHALISLQKPSMEFLSGFRENLVNVVALGRLSPEVAKMAGFVDMENFTNVDSVKSVGWYLNDRNKLFQVRVPFITDFDSIHANIIEGVTRSG